MAEHHWGEGSRSGASLANSQCFLGAFQHLGDSERRPVERMVASKYCRGAER
jgi:hypothetical protein